MSAQKNSLITIPRILMVAVLSLVLATQFAALPGCGGEDTPAPTGPGPHIEDPPDTIPPADATGFNVTAGDGEIDLDSELEALDEDLASDDDEL